MKASRHFHVLAKPTGAICNLDCKYCFFLSKEMLYPGDRFQMADDLPETYIRHSESQPGPDATIAWQGGEPTLMGLDFFRPRDRLHPEATAALAFTSSTRFRPTERNSPANGASSSGSKMFWWASASTVLLRDAMISIEWTKAAGRHSTRWCGAADEGVSGRIQRPHDRAFGQCRSSTRRYHFLRDEIGTRFIQLIPIVERVTAETLPLANLGWGERTSSRPLYLQEGNLVTERTV
jgi:uncharacterized protein